MSNRDNTNTYVTLVGIICALVGGLIGTTLTLYFGPILQGNEISRTELAQDLANFYSAAGAEYYADQDLTEADSQGWNKNSPYYIALLQREDAHYKDFLSASTKLTSEVPPDLRNRVLKIEDDFDNFSESETASTTDQWFNDLDSIRQQVLDATIFRKSMEDVWK